MAGHHLRRRRAAAGGPDARLRGRPDGGAGCVGAAGGAGRYPHRRAAPPRRDRGGVPAADRRADDPRPGRAAPAPDRAHRPGRPARPASVLERTWTPAMAAAGPGSVYLTGAAAEAAACDAVLTTIVTGQIDWPVLDQLTTVWLDPPPTTTPPPPAARRNSRAGRAAGSPSADGLPDSQPGRAARSTAPGRPDRRSHHANARPAEPRRRTDASRQTRQPLPPAPAPATSRAPASGSGPFPGTGHSPPPRRRRAARTARSPAAWKPPGDGCRPPSCAGASTCSPAPAGSPPTCAAPCSPPPSTPPASPSTSAAPPAPSHPTCAPPSPSATSTASSPRCTQPASVCDVHHLIHWAHGGPTSLGNLRLLCRFHHLIVIHRWGWTITCHPDGTRTATAPDGTHPALPRPTPASRLTGGESPAGSSRAVTPARQRGAGTGTRGRNRWVAGQVASVRSCRTLRATRLEASSTEAALVADAGPGVPVVPADGQLVGQHEEGAGDVGQLRFERQRLAAGPVGV